MMKQFRKVQDSWLGKGVLILTALSFVSLFGISGYINEKANNRPIIEVDDIVITQSEITNSFNQKMQSLQNVFGDTLDINETIRQNILAEIVQQELMGAIIRKTAQDNNIYISDALVRKIIFSQPEFMDANGRFSKEKLLRLLRAANLSEQAYIDALRQDMAALHLVKTPAMAVNVSKVMLPYLAALENQRKVFKYILINPADLKTDRKISQEELEQYYQDFAPQFVEPEARDVSFIVLSVDDAARKFTPTEEEIAAYYQENISNFVIPESRNILQMVFDTQEKADKAAARLKAGEDFYKVAQEEAGQNKADTELGYASKDMLIADMSEPVFALKVGEFVGPVKSEMGWHIMKVTGIKPMQETKLEAARPQIVEALKKDRAYEYAYENSTMIEDQIGAGASLDDIAKSNDTSIYKISGLKEDGSYKSAPKQFAKLIKSNDFVDTAFSYNPNEVSQVFETDDGFVVLKVNAIHDAHPQELDEVRPTIVKMWENDEKAAIAQEIIKDVLHDLESGDNIDEVARRFSLKLNTSKPIKRGENFDNLTTLQMSELFKEKLNNPKVLDLDGEQMIVVATKVINDKHKLTSEEEEVLLRKAQFALSQDATTQMINSFGKDYNIKVDYKSLGLAD